MLQKHINITENKNYSEEHAKSASRIEVIKKKFYEMEFPFDFAGDEPESDPLWELVKMITEEGFLTNDQQPTEMALTKDFIRFNNGSRHFPELSLQPALLFTGKFLIYLDNLHHEKYTNYITK